jgi:hypothetical protein
MTDVNRKTMTKIIVAYYHLAQLLDEYQHNTELDYSRAKINDIQNLCLDRGLSYMTVPYENQTIIWIGKGKLSQR